jgi:hypothetical protein
MCQLAVLGPGAYIDIVGINCTRSERVGRSADGAISRNQHRPVCMRPRYRRRSHGNPRQVTITTLHYPHRVLWGELAHKEG